jgi:hypothetical protein
MSVQHLQGVDVDDIEAQPADGSLLPAMDTQARAGMQETQVVAPEEGGRRSPRLRENGVAAT